MAQLFIYEIRKVWLVKCRLFDLYLRKETVDQLEGGGVKGGGKGGERGSVVCNHNGSRLKLIIVNFLFHMVGYFFIYYHFFFVVSTP